MTRFAFASLFFLFAASLPSIAHGADFVTGTVVDQNGQPLPRAEVRVLDRTGAETSHVFADEMGRFRVATSSDDCRVAAALTGFQPASIPCAPSPLRLTLNVAP